MTGFVACGENEIYVRHTKIREDSTIAFTLKEGKYPRRLPRVTHIYPGKGFTVKASLKDFSTYNYQVT